MKIKSVAIAIIVCLFAYLTLFTWNLRTGVLDGLASYTGLEFVSLSLRPGQWVVDKTSDFVSRYVYLVGVREDYDKLKDKVDQMELELSTLREKAQAADRLEKLLLFSPPESWIRLGARVISHRFGPVGILETIIVDKGRLSRISRDTPVVAPQGVVGRVLEAGLSASKVLLLTDFNSRVSVIGQTNRSSGIIVGQGTGHPLKVRFVKLNSRIDQGELLVTSGLDGLFPKGLPVARVKSTQKSDISLFMTITAEPLVDMRGLEEVLLLLPDESSPESGETSNSTLVNGTDLQNGTGLQNGTKAVRE